MRYFLILIFLFTVPCALSDEVKADDLADCNQGGIVLLREDLERQTRGCTRLLNSGRLDRKKRVLAYYHRGSAYFLRGNTRKAIVDYSEAIKLNPKFEEAYLKRGNAYHEIEQTDSAITDYTEAIKINPNSENAYGNRGNVYNGRSQYKKAIADYTKVIVINPNDDDIYIRRGNAYFDDAQLNYAIRDFRSVLERNPFNAAAKHGRLRYFEKSGNSYFKRKYKKYLVAGRIVIFHPISKKAVLVPSNQITLTIHSKISIDRVKYFNVTLPIGKYGYYSLELDGKVETDFTIKKISYRYHGNTYDVFVGDIHSGCWDNVCDFLNTIIFGRPQSERNSEKTYETVHIEAETLEIYPPPEIQNLPSLVHVRLNYGDIRTPKSYNFPDKIMYIPSYHIIKQDNLKRYFSTLEIILEFYSKKDSKSKLLPVWKERITEIKGLNIDNDACNQSRDVERRINGCTRLLEPIRFTKMDRAIANSNQALAYTNRGIAYIGKGQLARAIADYNQAIKLDPKSALAYQNRGVAYAKKDEFDRAFADFTEVIKLTPNEADAYSNRGGVYAKKGQWDLAAQDYGRSLNLTDKPTAYDHNIIAWARFKAGRAAKGLHNAQTSVALDPKGYNAWNTLGTIHEAMGHKDKAIEAYRKAMALDPKHEMSRDDLKRLGILP